DDRRGAEEVAARAALSRPGGDGRRHHRADEQPGDADAEADRVQERVVRRRLAGRARRRHEGGQRQGRTRRPVKTEKTEERNHENTKDEKAKKAKKATRTRGSKQGTASTFAPLLCFRGFVFRVFVIPL